MPVLHSMMTGAMGQAHSSDWHIADVDSGYLAPARTLAMMAVDLLCNMAAIGCGVLSQHEPALTNEEYLRHQSDIFRTVTFDGASCIWERGEKTWESSFHVTLDDEMPKFCSPRSVPARNRHRRH